MRANSAAFALRQMRSGPKAREAGCSDLLSRAHVRRRGTRYCQIATLVDENPIGAVVTARSRGALSGVRQSRGREASGDCGLRPWA